MTPEDKEMGIVEDSIMDLLKDVYALKIEVDKLNERVKQVEAMNPPTVVSDEPDLTPERIHKRMREIEDADTGVLDAGVQFLYGAPMGRK